MVQVRVQSNNIECALRCMTTLSRYATEDILPHLQSMLDQLFFYMDRTSSYKQRTLFLPILTHIADMIHRWCTEFDSSPNHTLDSLTVKNDSSHEKKLCGLNKSKNLEDVVLSIQSFLRKGSDTRDDDDQTEEGSEATKENDVDGDTNEVNEDIEEDKKVYRAHVDLLKRIINRCINMLSSSCPHTRKRCIETIQCCLLALNTENDQDLIRPLIHQVWMQLESRFKDKHYPVLLAAVELVDTMSNIAGDFLFCKVRGSFMVKLSEVLEQAALISLSITDTLKYTGLYKMQRRLMRFMANLIIKTDYRGYTEIEGVINSMLLYLTKEQPEELVEECKQALRSVALDYDPYIVWYKVSRIISELKCDPQFSLVGNLPIRNSSNHTFSHHYLKPCQDLINNIEFDTVLKSNN